MRSKPRPAEGAHGIEERRIGLSNTDLVQVVAV